MTCVCLVTKRVPGVYSATEVGSRQGHSSYLSLVLFHNLVIGDVVSADIVSQPTHDIDKTPVGIRTELKVSRSK
jgi:hypothetical protein